jgi:putative endonuclease
MAAGMRAVGAYGERVAARHLIAAGLEVLDRNWRGPDGELDIIARECGTVVFCEVKTRRGNGYGLPAEAITPTKSARIRRLATCWLAEKGFSGGQVRFDVVSVWPQRSGPAAVEHLRGAF